MTTENNRYDDLYWANRDTFLRFPVSTQVQLEYPSTAERVQFATVIEHRFNHLGEIILNLDVVGESNHKLRLVHPKNDAVKVVKLKD